MARITGTPHSEKLNKAIVDKVESVLNNTESIRDMDIRIQGSIAEVPTIRYCIEEVIKWDSESEEDNG